MHMEELARHYLNLSWNQGNFEQLRPLTAASFTYHNTFNDKILNFDEYAAFVSQLRLSVPNMHLLIDDVMSRERRAMVHSIFCGTVVEPFFDIPASQHPIAFPAISRLEFDAGGKVETLNTLIDVLGVQRQVTGQPDQNADLDIA